MNNLDGWELLQILKQKVVHIPNKHTYIYIYIYDLRSAITKWSWFDVSHYSWVLVQSRDCSIDCLIIFSSKQIINFKIFDCVISPQK